MQRVQSQIPKNFPFRIDLCIYMRYGFKEPYELFTEKASFSGNAILNFYMNHFWVKGRVNAVEENHFQVDFVLNIEQYL